MKKLILTLIFTSLLSISAFAERYPIEFEYGFISGCSEDYPNLKNFCICALKEMESKYTLEEVMSYIKDKSRYDRLIKEEIIPKCMHFIK